MKKIAMLVMVAVLALGLTACGGGGETGKEVKIDVVAGEGGKWVFNPGEFNVAKGDKVTVNLTNKDSVKHDFVVGDFNVKIVADAGKTATGTFVASKAGTFQVICAEPGHKDSGMVAKLNVK